MDLLSIDLDRHDGLVIARLSGEIDISNTATLRARLEEEVGNHLNGLIIDLTGVAFLDSSGMSLFFDLGERLNTLGQSMRLVVPKGAIIRRTLEIVALPSQIPTVETVDQALAELTF